MKRIACCIVVGLVVSAVASGNDIRIRFGRPETVPPTTPFEDAPDFTPTAYPNGTTVQLGIWAQLECDISDPIYPLMDIWNGIAINIVANTAPAGSFHVDYTAIDNFDHRIGVGTAYRWDGAPDPGPTAGFAVSAPGMYHGLGGLYPREFELGNGSTDWWSYTSGTPGAAGTTYHYWLGNVSLYGDSTAVYFQIGGQLGPVGISRQGGDVSSDLIYFGADETVPLHGNEIGAISSLPDLVFIPEPAGLMMLALAGLCLRPR